MLAAALQLHRQTGLLFLFFPSSIVSFLGSLDREEVLPVHSAARHSSPAKHRYLVTAATNNLHFTHSSGEASFVQACVLPRPASEHSKDTPRENAQNLCEPLRDGH